MSLCTVVGTPWTNTLLWGQLCSLSSRGFWLCPRFSVLLQRPASTLASLAPPSAGWGWSWAQVGRAVNPHSAHPSLLPMSLLSPSSLGLPLSLQLSRAASLLIHVLWHMINPTSHISSHVSAPSLLYRLILKWSDTSVLKYHQIKTAGMCKQSKYTPKSINQMKGSV